MADTLERKEIVPDSQVEELLAQARAAYEADKSSEVAKLCQSVLEADPDNVEAWDLLAKFGGWDSKLYRLDLDFALDAAKRALDLVSESGRYEAASEIYLARKRQIALVLESEMMMPSYTAAKQMQETMMHWQRLLEEMPFLSISLLEREIALCSNLCLRSKLGIMPGDRLVYTAYMEFNGKEPYGESFRKALAPRIRVEEARREELLADALDQAQRLREALGGEAAAKDAAGLERYRGECAVLAAQLETLVGLTSKAALEEELGELDKQMAKLGPLKYFKRKELTGKVEALKAKIAQVDADFEQQVAPIREVLGFFGQEKPRG